MEQVDGLWCEVSHLRLDPNRRVKLSNVARRCERLRSALQGVLFIEQNLALQIAGLNEIAVDDANVSNAGAGQQTGQGGPDGAASHNR